MSQRHGRGAMFADKSRTRDSWQLVKILLGYMVDYKRAIAVVAGVITVYTVLATYQPIILQQALDILISNKQGNLNLLVGIFVTVSILVWVFQSLNTWLMADISTGLVDKLRKMAFTKLVHADMAYHHKNQSGNVTSRVVNDTNEVATGITVFTQTSTQILLIFATFFILVTIDWRIALISLIAIPIAFIISKVMGTIGRRRMLSSRQAYGLVSGKLAENLAGVAIAKSFNQEERVSQEIRVLNDKTYEYMKALLSVFILVFPSISMVSTLLVFGVLYTGGWLYSQNLITIGNIFLATIMVQRFLRPIIDLSNNYTQLQASLAALDRITDIFEAYPAIQNVEDAKPLVVSGGLIEFDDVDFAYEEDNYVLQDISFRIEAGKQLALVGHTGAGKTTITALLMRFYDPIQGEIRIDGQSIKDVTLETLNDTISLVSQEPYLFADTVMENIRYGKPEATDTDIYDICQLIGADEFIEALPHGYETSLDESGKNLSAGQRQMITIARTMLSDPKILVLDEATSRLDAYSESLVQNAQRLLFKGRTTLIIAHRLSTIRDVDYLVVLEDGRIIEQGDHDQLLKNNGKYAELYHTYYAHQGTGKIEVSVLEGSGAQVESKHGDGTIHLNSSLREKQQAYREMMHIKVDQVDDAIFISGNSHSFGQILDQFLQMVGKICEMHQLQPDLKLRGYHQNGYVTVDIEHRDIFISEKAQQAMLGNGGPMAHGPSLPDLVASQNGKFDIISPLPEKTKGVIFRMNFPKTD